MSKILLLRNKIINFVVFYVKMLISNVIINI